MILHQPQKLQALQRRNRNDTEEKTSL